MLDHYFKCVRDGKKAVFHTGRWWHETSGARCHSVRFDLFVQERMSLEEATEKALEIRKERLSAASSVQTSAGSCPEARQDLASQ